MAQLNESRLFEGLAGEELTRLAEVAVLERYEEGQQIFQEGDPGTGIYVVKQGSVKISGMINQDERRTLAVIGEGDFFGEMAVLDNEPRSATVTAREAVEVFFIPREDLLRMLEQSPRMVIGLMRLFSLRLRDFNRQYINEVLQAERLTVVGKFARSIVHDLKNPLNVIGLAAELAGSEGSSEEMRVSARDRIRKQVDRLTLMINELLEFTRGSKRQMILSEVDYGTFLTTLVKDFAPDVEPKGVELRLEGELPKWRVLVDPMRLLHVVHNLINNAVDAMASDGGVITIRCLPAAKGKHLITEIEDSGPGIADEIAGSLFEAFATHGKANGTGLGLSICKKIITEHGGTIAARNEPDRGAVFAFTLPLPARGNTDRLAKAGVAATEAGA